MIDISDLLKPENDIEKLIISDSEFQDGALFGEPRPGHPEGQVVFHIKEVLSNVEKYSKNPIEREKLRLIAFTHDTFKFKVDNSQSKSGENHHAMIARRFAEKYINDSEILEIIELHDEAFNSWQKGFRDEKWDKAEVRAQKLVDRFGNSLNLYLSFYRCDNDW